MLYISKQWWEGAYTVSGRVPYVPFSHVRNGLTQVTQVSEIYNHTKITGSHPWLGWLAILKKLSSLKKTTADYKIYSTIHQVGSRTYKLVFWYYKNYIQGFFLRGPFKKCQSLMS